MFTKIILFAVLAACGVQSKQAPSPGEPLGAKTTLSTAAAYPEDKQPDEIPLEEGQHFCCQQVDLKDKSGEGCITVGPAQVDTCSELLYCAGDYGKSGGKTKCLD